MSKRTPQTRLKVLEQVFERAAMGIAVLDSQTGAFLEVNQKYAEIVGRTVSELLGETFMSITHPADLEVDQESLRRLKAGEIDQFSLEKRYVNSDGEVRWVRVTVSPLWESGSAPTSHVKIAQDITQQRQAQDRLSQGEEQLRHILDSVADGVLTIDASQRIRATNRAGAELFGCEAGELLGQPITSLLPDFPSASAAGSLVRGVEGVVDNETLRLLGLHRVGVEIPLDVSISVSRIDASLARTVVLRDVSARIQEEQRLRRDAQEKETLEQLVALSSQIDSALTVSELMTRLGAGLHTLLPFDRVSCALLDDQRSEVASLWTSSASSKPGTELKADTVPAESGLHAVLELGRPRINNNLVAYARGHPESENTRGLVSAGFRSVLACPLLVLGRRVGLLFFSSRRSSQYGPEHIQAAERLAPQIAVIIERVQLLEQLAATQKQLEERNKVLGGVFRRYTSDEIALHLLEEPHALEMGGRPKVVTLLFADLCRFSALCNALDGKRVMRMLNTFLTAMTPIIKDHDGTIDEFIGDSILAVFGAPFPLENHASCALQCALEMQAAMAEVNEQLSERGLPQLQMSLALHTGEVMVGNIGSRMRAKYGMVGTAVNVVSRIESYARPGQILCSRSTMRAAREALDYDDVVLVTPKDSHERLVAVGVSGVREDRSLRRAGANAKR